MSKPDVKVKAAVGRMIKKSTAQTLITDKECETCPLIMSKSRCRGRVRIYVNQAIGGNWCQCSKNRRPGKLTCFWHKHLEDDNT